MGNAKPPQSIEVAVGDVTVLPLADNPSDVAAELEKVRVLADLEAARELTGLLRYAEDGVLDSGIASIGDRIGRLAPSNPIQEMLGAQMVALHRAAMDCASRAARTDYEVVRRDNLSLLNKTTRSFASLVEAYDRHGRGGQQKVIVEHVTVEAGGQAIVGRVEGVPGR